MNSINPKYKTFLATTLSLLLFCAVGVAVAAAQGEGSNPGQGGGSNSPTIDNPFKGGDSLQDFLVAIIDNIIMPIGVVLAVLAFIYTGFLFVTAQGNDSKLTNAKKALVNSAIGTAVLLGAWSIATVVRNTVNQLMN
jgi:hypothetical protein